MVYATRANGSLFPSERLAAVTHAHSSAHIHTQGFVSSVHVLIRVYLKLVLLCCLRCPDAHSLQSERSVNTTIRRSECVLWEVDLAESVTQTQGDNDVPSGICWALRGSTSHCAI